MKTRDKILLTSLTLFNEEGEPNVTTVDIANEMDISPGNLYYHFKGKESIIEALYQEYDHQLTSLLHQSIKDPLSIEEHWLFIYVVFEEIHKFRFFYLNAPDLMLRYPDIEKKFRRLLKTKLNTIETLCKNLLGNFSSHKVQVDTKLLAENIGLSVVYWFPYQALIHPELDANELIHKAVYHVLNLIIPYTGENQAAFTQGLLSMYKKTI